MKTVIEMAQEAGWKDLRDYDSQMQHDFFMGNTDSLARFAELVRADEREAICNFANSEAFNRQHGEQSPYAYELVAAIRARGNT